VSESLAAQEHVHNKEAELSVVIQETSEIRKEHRQKMEALAEICARFSDVLPFWRSSRRRSAVCSVKYNGPIQPRTRIEQLAFDIHGFFTARNPVGGRTTWL
jgi:hypothetical protein